MGLAGLQISLTFAIGQAMLFKRQRMVVCAEHVSLKAPHVSIATGILLPIGAALVHASQRVGRNRDCTGYQSL